VNSRALSGSVDAAPAAPSLHRRASTSPIRTVHLRAEALEFEVASERSYHAWGYSGMTREVGRRA